MLALLAVVVFKHARLSELGLHFFRYAWWELSAVFLGLVSFVCNSTLSLIDPVHIALRDKLLLNIGLHAKEG